VEKFLSFDDFQQEDSVPEFDEPLTPTERQSYPYD
jgi:hypothetical protein